MPQYVDTQLKRFPFRALSQAHTITMENESQRRPETNRHMFDFDYFPDEPWATMENLEEVDAILLQKLGTTLNDMQ
jgi:hypothetical protein